MARPKKQKGFDSIKEHKVLTATGDVFTIEELFKPEDFFESKKGDLYVLHDALRFVVREKIGKVVSYAVEVHQCPQKSNEWCAVVSVRYEIILNKLNDGKYTGIFYQASADCRTGNATGFKEYTTAIAETRASARCLRNILGLSICSKEEAFDIDNLVGQSMDEPAENNQLILIEKKIIKEAKWTKEKLEEVIGQPIKDIKHLTKGEAAQIIDSFNSKR